MMRYARHARYAAAALFALLAAIFVALWVRSFEHLDRWNASLGDERGIYLASYHGVIGCGCRERKHYESNKWLERGVWRRGLTGLRTGLLAFHVERGHAHRGVTFPHWFLAASCLGIAALLAFKRTWRFSLRTILVATTVLAALLGLVVS
jgi:hypothetical protein